MTEAVKCGFYHWNQVYRTAARVEHEQPWKNLVGPWEQGPSTVWLWGPLSWWLFRFWLAAFLGSPWTMVLATICSCWVSLGLFYRLLWSTRPLNLHSIHITWLTKSKSANTMKTSEAKLNYIIKGINRTIKHTNALKWLPNTYEIFCKYNIDHSTMFKPLFVLKQILKKTDKGRCI